jgi:hypothetical protein
MQMDRREFLMAASAAAFAGCANDRAVRWGHRAKILRANNSSQQKEGDGGKIE